MITLKDIDIQTITPEELGELLIEAKKAYYTGGRPLMDDSTYDTLEEILRQKNPYHRLFSKVGTPAFDTGFPKQNHLMPMGSQNKVNTYTDLVHYFELKKIPTDSQFVVQPKCDGLSLEIVYQEGRVVQAITRGDGVVGDVITQNVVKMKNFKETLPQNFTGSLRCEIVVTYDDFKILNQLAQNQAAPQSPSPDQPAYSNPRNAASGISQRLDGKYSQYLTLYAVDLAATEVKFNTEWDQVQFLQQMGVTVVESHLCSDFSQIETIYQEFLTQKRDSYPFDIDGLVIKINDQQIQQSLGSHNNRPKGQVAYKFPSRTDQTQIKSVNWQTGPMGTVTPVAEVDPIEISGAVITFASLANYDLVRQMNVNLGDIVEISRRGDVIPHIEKVISKVTPGHFDPPQNCPACGTALQIDTKFLRCPNTARCPAQVLGTLRLFCATLDILGISDKTIAKLHASGKLNLPGDFYNLTVADFENLEGLGEKSGTNIINQIQSKRELTLKQVFDAASIPNFSAARIQQVIDAGFTTPQHILSLKVADLEALPGFQSTLAAKVVEGITLRRPVIDSILAQVTIKKENKVGSQLTGQTFVITGSLSRPRKDIIKDIEQAGGKVAATVSPNTNYLVTNDTDSSSSKFQAAKKLNIPIITESQLTDLLTT